MYFEIDRYLVDYPKVRIDGIPGWEFRGSVVNQSDDFIACVGAAQTFGRFCKDPFPLLLWKRLGIQTINLGVGGAGPTFFHNPNFLDVLNRSSLVILQVMAARSEDNSLFVHESHRVPGTRLSDGRRMRIESFLQELLETQPIDVVKKVIAETRQSYIGSTLSLLESISPPTILFWFSAREPGYRETYDGKLQNLMGMFPQLVDLPTLEAIRPSCDFYVKCVSKRGRPQYLGKANQVKWPKIPKHMTVPSPNKDGEVYDWYYPSPEMHVDASDALEPICRRILSL